MKNITRAFVALSLASVSVVVAQPPGSDSGQRGSRRGPPGGSDGPGGPGGRGVPPLIRALDTDRDGEISATEIANSAVSLKTLVKNGDGVISAEDLRPARPADAHTPPAGASARDHRPRPVMPLMLALDANGDGELSAAEIANAPASLKALDANGDGKLTRDELRPLPPADK